VGCVIAAVPCCVTFLGDRPTIAFVAFLAWLARRSQRGTCDFADTLSGRSSKGSTPAPIIQTAAPFVTVHAPETFLR
jgi:hypothetical protein